MPSTPFFKEFGPLLFGRAPRRMLEDIKSCKSLANLYEFFGQFLEDKLLEPTANGANSRQRALPPRVTFWAFLSQVLSPATSCREVVRKIEAWWRWAVPKRSEEQSLTTSAYCQARGRLDVERLDLVSKSVAHACERNVLTEERWQGRSVKIVDGTGLSMPDTVENQKAWPQPGSQKPGVGFPHMKLLGLFSLASGALMDHVTADYYTHETAMFRQMWSRLTRGDVILGDRAFCSFVSMHELSRKGVDSVFRLHQARQFDARKGKVLGRDDRLVTWTKPVKAPAGYSAEEHDALPDAMQVRLIRLEVQAPGFRTKTIVLATTLLDPEAYPADAIRDLYAQRWAVELHFHQIKVTLGLDVLKCKSPEMIEKELLMHVIAYNMVRALMQRSAHLHRVSLRRISFKGALDTIRHFAQAIHAARKTPKKQADLIDQMLELIASDPVPERPGRSEPRVKKRRPKNYKLMTEPRNQTDNQPHRNRPEKLPKSRLS